MPPDIYLEQQFSDELGDQLDPFFQPYVEFAVPSIETKREEKKEKKKKEQVEWLGWFALWDWFWYNRNKDT